MHKTKRDKLNFALCAEPTHLKHTYDRFFHLENPKNIGSYKFWNPKSFKSPRLLSNKISICTFATKQNGTKNSI